MLPHMPLQASPKMEPVPTWKRRTFDLARQRTRREKLRQARARNGVRSLHCSRGYAVSRKLRVRSEHTFAGAKTRHGMGRARGRGCERVQVQAELVGIVQNLKRLAAFQGRKRRGRASWLAPAPHLLPACLFARLVLLPSLGDGWHLADSELSSGEQLLQQPSRSGFPGNPILNLGHGPTSAPTYTIVVAHRIEAGVDSQGNGDEPAPGLHTLFTGEPPRRM